MRDEYLQFLENQESLWVSKRKLLETGLFEADAKLRALKQAKDTYASFKSGQNRASASGTSGHGMTVNKPVTVTMLPPPDSSNRKALRGDGLTRDVYEILQLYPSGLRPSEIAKCAAVDNKPVRTTLIRGLKDGTIARDKGMYLLTESGKALLKRSAFYIGRLAKSQANEKVTATSLESESVAATRYNH